MKFSKTYLQTMTDPAFPQEWREKGLEYKELKKLINGVVAELESLGLSADVLRDLLEPPEQDEAATSAAAARSTSPRNQRDSRSRSGSASASDSGDDALHSGLVAGLAKLSTGRQGPSDFVDPLSPLMEEEEARRKSAEQTMAVPIMSDTDMPAPAVGLERKGSTSTPAGEWISHLESSHHHHRRPRSTRGKSSSSAGDSSRESSAPLEQAGSPSNVLHQEPTQDNFLKPSDDAPVGASPMSLLGIRKRRESSNEERHSSNPVAGSSASRELSPGATWRMGRKDLEKLRRHSHSGHKSAQPHDAKKASRSPGGSEDGQPHDWGGHAWRERAGLGWDVNNGNGAASSSMHAAKSTPPIARGPGKPRWVQGKDGRRARAEYELGGTTEHPIPRIRLTIESPVDSDSESDDADGEDDGEEDRASIADRIKELPPSQPGSRRASLAEEAAPFQHAPHDNPPPPTVMRTREIIIPLTADTQFLDTLTHSLTQLSELQSSQREDFITSTEDLCASVARAASPYASKNDIYVWREIFQLWVDMQIFEGQTEKTRGELSVDESEARLKRFAQELVKRGWLAQSSVGSNSPKLSRNKAAVQNALSLPMRDSRSTNAVEDFLRLNLALLDVKKFQRVNVEAARKILKKHDKRTALTASSGLREFVRQQESTRAAAAAAAASSLGMHLPPHAAEMTGTLVAPAHGTHPSLAALLPSSTTGLLSESLPHILLSLLTTTLLPILPSVDDYSCAICTGLAWRPIRLDCSHLFCIRCLVKLQKQGKTDCPLCRAKGVVKTADGRNLDEATVNMLKMWFPNEISEKDHENERDRKKEELAEFGLEQHKCVVM